MQKFFILQANIFFLENGSAQVLFISAILAVASAGFAPTCDECNAAAQGLLVQ